MPQIIFESPGPILLELGQFQLRWYGLLTAIAFVVCLQVAGKICAKKYPQISADELSDFAIVTIVSGLVGARLWFVVLNYEYFAKHPIESFQIWLGGQSIQGAIAGAAIGTLIFELIKIFLNKNQATKNKFDFDKLKKTLQESYLPKLSLAALVTPLGQAIGRWGNFFNEEAYGSVTKFPIKVFISDNGSFHHPTFLYESFGNLIIFLIMIFVIVRLKPIKIIAVYLMLYSILRLMIEPIRTDSLMIGDLPAAIVVSIIMLILGIFLAIKK